MPYTEEDYIRAEMQLALALGFSDIEVIDVPQPHGLPDVRMLCAIEPTLDYLPMWARDSGAALELMAKYDAMPVFTRESVHVCISPPTKKLNYGFDATIEKHGSKLPALRYAIVQAVIEFLKWNRP